MLQRGTLNDAACLPFNGDLNRGAHALDEETSEAPPEASPTPPRVGGALTGWTCGPHIFRFRFRIQLSHDSHLERFGGQKEEKSEANRSKRHRAPTNNHG